MRIQPSKFYDPEDEERRWELEHMSRFAGQPAFEPDMEFSIEEAEGTGAYAPPPDPDEERAYQTLQGGERRGPRPQDYEQDAIRAVRDSYANDEGNFWEENTVPIIAGGVDLLFNKGRSLGPIVAGAGMAAATRDQSRKSNMRQLAQMQLSMSDADVKREHQERMYGLQEGNLKARNAELEEMRARRMGQSPDDWERALRDAQAANLEARTWETYAQPGAGQMTAAQAAADADRDELRADRKAERSERALDREEVRAGRQQQQQYVNEERAEKTLDAQRNKFRDETERSRPQVSRAMAVEDLVRRNPDDIPGVGMWDSLKGKIPLVGSMLSSEDDIAMRGNLTDMADLILRERSGAAAPPAEVVKLAQNVAAGGGVTEKEFSVLQGEYNRMLKSGLQQQSVGREGIARDVLGSEASKWALGASQEPPPDRVTGPVSRPDPIRLLGTRGGAPSGGDNFDYSGTPDQLPVTGQKRGEVEKVDDYLKRYRNGGFDFRWED